MDQWRRIPRGPVRKSCLTCKRRHKKCDRGKPICERCTKGGFECLGYERNRSNGSVYDQPLASNPSRPTSSQSLLPEPLSSPSSPFLRTNDAPQSDIPCVLNDIVTTPDSYGIDSGAEYFMPPSLPCGLQPDFSNPSARHDIDSAIYETLPSISSGAQTTETRLLSPSYTNGVVAQQSIFPSGPYLLAFASEIPRGVSIAPSNVRDIVGYVISYFGRVCSTMYFQPQDTHIESSRRVAVWRLSTCPFTRGVMLIDAKIRDSIPEGSDSGHGHKFAHRIEVLEQMVRVQLGQPLTTDNFRERLIDSLQIFFAKSIIVNAAATYRLFCRLASNFLHIVNCTPTLCWAKHDPTSVSVAHLLASPFYECVNYMFMDVVGSMVYGLPQILAYNTDIGLFHTRLHTVEWVNCLPGEFLVLLARINSCRDHGRSNWQDIEQRLVSWEPQSKFEPKGLESWKMVAWRALEEIWRHTLLIYLYLAVCAVPTDDRRIQLSLRQIFQLTVVIKRQDPPIANAYIFAPILIAGICSNTEKRRKLIRERLGYTAKSRFWLFHGPEFVPVLDHLWLGAGIGGQPIAWSDYIHSRDVMLPLSS